MSSSRPLSFLAVAGEASGDRHGSEVLARLGQLEPQASFFGLGMDCMIHQGLELSGDPSVLGVVGLSEAVSGLRRAHELLRRLLEQARSRRPAAALLIDVPDFNLPLARGLQRLGIPVVYYIAPQAWAWRRGRVKKLRRRVSRLCVVFPFEKDFFAAHGIDVEYVGHPLAGRIHPAEEGDPDRVLLLPGSRRREIDRLLPPMLQAARLLQRHNPHLHFVLAPGISLEPGWLEKQVPEDELCLRLEDPGAATRLLPGSRLAICASGTVTLEAALAGVPQVVIYKVSRLTYLLASLLVRIPYVCIVNILAGRQLVPELLQGRARPECIAVSAQMLLDRGAARQRVLQGYRQLRQQLQHADPAGRVARALLEVAGR